MTADQSGEDTEREPDQFGTHVKSFEAGFGVDSDLDDLQHAVSEDMERLANRVGRPCEVVVRIEVYDQSQDAESDRSEDDYHE
ncbi:hypothetical protein [Halosolutus gelatinilyticus]|uniref:hypothetical protein n=1 Tax=Halosolutus gelatinilyticus TaxID=2931975 RepID=UPI001FF46AE5|nr:hypothetical protein [Halosolutus gelatinilyticus]